MNQDDLDRLAGLLLDFDDSLNYPDDDEALITGRWDDFDRLNLVFELLYKHYQGSGTIIETRLAKAC